MTDDATRSCAAIYREQAAEAARIVASWPESMRKAIWPPRKEKPNARS